MDKRFITQIQGQDFVKFEGLLNEFHNNGGKEIYTEIIQNTPELIIRATVKGEKGTYQGIGDANENNVNRLIAVHKIRMAETRAIARALRWYNNIGMCSADEMGYSEKTPKMADTGVSSQKTVYEPLPEEQRNPVVNNVKKSLNKCEKCGADMVLNPKTGRVFCKEKCWLK